MKHLNEYQDFVPDAVRRAQEQQHYIIFIDVEVYNDVISGFHLVTDSYLDYLNWLYKYCKKNDITYECYYSENKQISSEYMLEEMESILKSAKPMTKSEYQTFMKFTGDVIGDNPCWIFDNVEQEYTDVDLYEEYKIEKEAELGPPEELF